MDQNSQNEGNTVFAFDTNMKQPYCNDGFSVSDNTHSVSYATSPYGHVSYPFNEAPNSGSSDINNNNRLGIVYSNATNAIQQGQSVSCDNYNNDFSDVPLNPSMPQYNGNPLQYVTSLPTTNLPNNNGPSSGIDIIHSDTTFYSNATNAVQPGQSVSCDDYSKDFSDVPLNHSLPTINPPNDGSSGIYNNSNIVYSNVIRSEQFSSFPPNPPVAQNNAITENPLQFVSSLPIDSPDKTFNSSQAQTNDSRIFSFMIPGFQIIVIPVPSP